MSRPRLEQPCFCKWHTMQYEAEWDNWRGQTKPIRKAKVGKDIASSKYINQRWHACSDCQIYAKRRAVILALFLVKLGVNKSRIVDDNEERYSP